MIKVHLFWAYGQLSKLEILSLKSFAKNNFNVHLWSYDKIKNAPTDCTLRDAREILPENYVFINQKNLMQVSPIYLDTLFSTKRAAYIQI